jgi:hypothetical protein
MKAAFLTFALIVLHALPAHAWHSLGHRTIAAIAWEQMTPLARARTMALLRSAPSNSGLRTLRPRTGTEAEKDRWQFIRAASWADAVRSGPRKQTYHMANWHFTDFYWQQAAPGAPARLRDDVPPYGDLVTKLPLLEASLRDAGNPQRHVSPSKGTDLAWFIHLMGDIAQPLHCSGRISPGHDRGDKGGNLFFLSERRDEYGECPDNLHAYWDDVLEREYGSNARVIELAASLSNSQPLAQSPALRLGEYKQWASIGRKIAMEVGYPAQLQFGVEPPQAYRNLVKSISIRAITLAGYRLGVTLNKVLDPH